VIKDHLAFKKLISSIDKILKIQQVAPPKKFLKMMFPFL